MPDLKAFTSGRGRSCVMRNNDKEVKIQYAYRTLCQGSTDKRMSAEFFLWGLNITTENDIF